ncbi:ATP-dependent helicase [candidate division KSB1 bacterium]
MHPRSKRKNGKGKGVSFPWEKELNPDQRRCVENRNGPVMVLAGAGSGKTRVIAYRIAYLVKSRTVRADKILALTFTNKAAEEMRQRIMKLIRPIDTPPLWIGTFHSMFARILRREARYIGYTGNYTIYDETDQLRAVKEVIKKGNIPIGSYTPKEILSIISQLKSKLISPAEYASRDNEDFRTQFISPVYTKYAEYLKRNNGMDFDDILLNTYRLFKNNPSVLKKYQNRFKYILVDEFQDTNLVQYRILLQLADKHQNICVVGDDDQSIYRWRGAEIKNILQFEHDFDNPVVIRLERNYRSTKNILTAANSVIKNNRVRHAKQLWTEREDGEKLNAHFPDSDIEEAQWIARSIAQRVSKEGRSWGDFAILYRYNAQSRLLEDSLRKDSIPYTVVGGLKFYDRKEVKDVLAYLSVLVNQDDEIRLKRIINYPPRGVGKKTIGLLEAYAESKKIPLIKALKHADNISGITTKRAEKLTELYSLIAKYRTLRKQVPMIELVESLVEEVKIIQRLKAETVHESSSRLENVQELLRAIEEYADQNPGADLESYLSEIALITDIDTWNENSDYVSLLTVHSAKGLEFPVVFITGLEEGIFPAQSSLDDMEALEEERRLFYVASTRAEDSLYISAAKIRGLFGKFTSYPPSRFISELDPGTVFQPDYEPAFSLESPRQRRASANRAADDFDTDREASKDYRVGMRVQHPDFGIGVIKSIEGSGESAKLSIVFQGNIEKKLLVQYAALSVAEI